MIFNIGHNEFRQLAELDPGIVCYYETEEKIEMYLIKSGSPVIYRYVYIKQGNEQDLIWKDDHISSKNVLRILSIEKEKSNFTISLRED